MERRNSTSLRERKISALKSYATFDCRLDDQRLSATFGRRLLLVGLQRSKPQRLTRKTEKDKGPGYAQQSGTSQFTSRRRLGTAHGSSESFVDRRRSQDLRS